jgi:hypothetical protein
MWLVLVRRRARTSLSELNLGLGVASSSRRAPAKDAVPLPLQGTNGEAASASRPSPRKKSKMQASAASPEPVQSRPVTEHPDACQRAPLSGSGGERCLITNEEGARPFHLVPRETWDADVSMSAYYQRGSPNLGLDHRVREGLALRP